MAPKDDLHFVYEQARRFVSARPWERLANGSFYLDLKVGSWHEACAQHFSLGSASALFLVPGHQTLFDLQRAGLAEPPPDPNTASIHAIFECLSKASA